MFNNWNSVGTTGTTFGITFHERSTPLYKEGQTELMLQYHSPVLRKKWSNVLRQTYESRQRTFWKEFSTVNPSDSNRLSREKSLLSNGLILNRDRAKFKFSDVFRIVCSCQSQMKVSNNDISFPLPVVCALLGDINKIMHRLIL